MNKHIQGNVKKYMILACGIVGLCSSGKGTASSSAAAGASLAASGQYQHEQTLSFIKAVFGPVSPKVLSDSSSLEDMAKRYRHMLIFYFTSYDSRDCKVMSWKREYFFSCFYSANIMWSKEELYLLYIECLIVTSIAASWSRVQLFDFFKANKICSKSPSSRTASK